MENVFQWVQSKQGATWWWVVKTFTKSWILKNFKFSFKKISKAGTFQIKIVTFSFISQLFYKHSPLTPKKEQDFYSFLEVNELSRLSWIPEFKDLQMFHWKKCVKSWNLSNKNNYFTSILQKQITAQISTNFYKGLKCLFLIFLCYGQTLNHDCKILVIILKVKLFKIK